MGLNIKNQETHRLAAEVAGLTGETMTQAITVALRERLDRLLRQQDIPAILARVRSIVDELQTERPEDHGKLLYDENVLPA